MEKNDIWNGMKYSYRNTTQGDDFFVCLLSIFPHIQLCFVIGTDVVVIGFCMDDDPNPSWIKIKNQSDKGLNRAILCTIYQQSFT
jgi:hypothetical protein